MENGGYQQKELENRPYLLYNQSIRNSGVIPGMYDNLTHFEPTFLTKGFQYLQVDVRPPFEWKAEACVRLPT